MTSNPSNKSTTVMNFLVEAEQLVSLKRRCILDNIAIDEELFFSIPKRRLPGHILKVKFAKAFNTVDWDFLFDHLKARGFGDKWVGWIWSIQFSLKVTILINGSRMDTFAIKEG